MYKQHGIDSTLKDVGAFVASSESETPYQFVSVVPHSGDFYVFFYYSDINDDKAINLKLNNK